MNLPLVVDAVQAFDAALKEVVHPKRSLCHSGCFVRSNVMTHCDLKRPFSSQKADSLSRAFWFCGLWNATTENCWIPKLRPLSLSLSHIFFAMLFRYTILHVFTNRAHHIAVGFAYPPQTRNRHCTDAKITKGNGRRF